MSAPNAYYLLKQYVDLQKRTKASVREVQKANTASYFAFNAGVNRYLIPVQDIAEVTHNIAELTALPFSPSWLIGLAAARGQVYSVIDFVRLMKVEVGEKPSNITNYLILGGRGEGFMLKVNEVLGIKNYNLSGIHQEEDYITADVEIDGIIWRLIDVARFVADDILFFGL